MKQKYFWNKKWFWISLTSLATIGVATFSLLTNNGKVVSANNLKKSQFADSSTPDPDIKTLSGYGYHALKTVDYVNWSDDSTKKIVDVFPTVSIANRVLAALQNANSSKFSLAANISSNFLKSDLAAVPSLDLSNLNLTNIDEILNPALVWSKLTKIDLSNNNFSDYVLKFDKAKMPKLYSITAQSANLNEMVDVSSYVTDPFDAATTGSDLNTKAKAEYKKALTTNVPRYFDLFRNNIPQIPKYYLKIALAYLNLGSNKLGSGTPADPQGVYAIPWYSMETSTTSSQTIGIADPDIRGPYGINLYDTGAKKADGGYLYSDEQVGRWRAQPYPIKSLRFAQYNLTENGSGALDTGVSFPSSDDAKATGGTNPYFNFGSNQLVNIPIFRQANVTYQTISRITPQNKNAVVFVGLDDYKKSKTYSSVTAGTKPEMITPQPDAIYPIIATWAWFNQQQNDNYFEQAMQGVFSPRSFNGFKQFTIGQDSRSDNTQWDNSVLIASAGSVTDGVAKWTTAPLGTGPEPGWSSTLPTNLFGSANNQGFLNFNNTSSTNYYKKWTSLRTFILSPKTFWKKSYGEKWTGPDTTIDSNLYWDTNLGDGIRADSWKSPWSGSQTADTLLPGGKKGKIWNYQTWVGHNVMPRRNGPGVLSQFLGVSADAAVPITNPYILGMSVASYFSNINTDSDYGTSQATPTPYTQGLGITAPGYNYNTNYQVVKEIKSDFKNAGNFPSNLESTGFNLGTKYKKNSKPVFAQNITVNDIKNGRGTFWNSTSEFDLAYMKTLDPNQIKIDATDLATGKLTYSFRVYAPGYSNLGRLFKNGDGQTSNSNDDSPTLDFEVKNTISGFAIPKFQMKAATGNNFVDVPTSGNLINNNVLSQKAPETFLATTSTTPITGNKNDETLKINIAKEFQTSYLGNTGTNPEVSEGTEKTLDSKFVEITTINNSLGTISFKVNVPDYVFTNGNRLDFPEIYKKLTFTWTGLPKANLTVKGKNLSGVMGVGFETFNINSFSELKTKAASQVTAADIINSEAITSNRGDWMAIKTDTSNYARYIDLNANNNAGILVWTLRLPGDAAGRMDGLLPLTLVVQWQGFQNQSTLISWKSNLGTLGLRKTPNELLLDIQANPEKYLNISQGRKNHGTAPFTTADFDFSNLTSTSIINNELGTVEVRGINLKSYYQHGIWVDNSTVTTRSTPKYLAVPNQILQAQKPYYVANFAEDSAAEGHKKIWDSVESFYQKNINDDSTESNAELVKTLSTSELKELIVKHKISPLSNVLEVSTSPANSFTLPPANLTYKNNNLKQSVVSDPLKGTLTFQGLSVKNWINNGSNTPEASHALASKTYQFSKLSNSWKWSTNLPLEVASLSPAAITNILNSSDVTKINDLLSHFNLGQKYYDNDGKLQNSYTINPQLVEVNPYLGKLIFQANAIQVTNWVTDGRVSTSPHLINETKTYDLANKLETQYQGNTNLTSGVNAFISDWVKITKSDSYENATTAQKEKYQQEFSQLNAPTYTNLDVDQGIALTKQYLKNNDLEKINATDMGTINTLKTSDTSLSDIDFTNYFYVPQYLLFLASPTNSTNSTDRTFAIAEKIEASSFTNTVMQLNNIYVINYYKSGAKTIQKIPDVLFSNFLQAVSTVNFKVDTTNNSFNLLPEAWQNLSASQIKQRLDYLTTNRNNQSVNDSSYYKKIQKEWVTTFTAKNIPYGGIRDLTIAYPTDIVASDYQRILVINKLLFPYFSQRATAANPQVIVLDNEIVSKQVWQAKLGFDSRIQQVANLNDESFAKIPSTLLTNLGLSDGSQTDSAATWKKLVEQNIYQLSGNLAPINNNEGVAPTVLIGNISVNDEKGTITFSNVQGNNVWVNGKQTNKAFADLVLNLGLNSTKLVKNPANTIEAWLSATTNSVDSIATKLIAFNTQLANGSFSLMQFNAMLNNDAAFFGISTPAHNLNTKIQVEAGFQPTDAFHLNMQTGEVTFSHLEIVQGYLNNQEVALQKVTEKLTFNLGWDYSTTFEQQFQSLLTQKRLFNANADHAATVLNQDPQQLLQYLNVQELAGQLETPSVSVSANSVLGKLTFNVKFKNYYQNGINVGGRDFRYTFSEFQQTLPAILGGIGAGLAVIVIALIVWYIRNYIKNKDQLMINTTKKKK